MEASRGGNAVLLGPYALPTASDTLHAWAVILATVHPPSGGFPPLSVPVHAASYVFRCAQPARLAALEVLLFDAFPRVEGTAVQAVLPHGQHKSVLRRTARVVRLAK
jgi:hypothetical protein